MKIKNDTQQKNLRDECKKIVETLHPDWFVTLTFRSNEVSEIYAIKTLKMFLNNVNRELFGRRSDQKLFTFIVQESNHSDGIHYHLLIQDPKNQTERTQAKELQRVLRKHWTKLRGSGYELLFSRNRWFKQVTDTIGISDYVTKTISTDTDAVNWELSNIPSNCVNV